MPVLTALSIFLCAHFQLTRETWAKHSPALPCVFLPLWLCHHHFFPQTPSLIERFLSVAEKKTSYETKKVPVTVCLIHRTPRQRWPVYGLLSVQSYIAQIMCRTLCWNGFESMAKQKKRDEKTRADARSPKVWNIFILYVSVLLRLTCWPCMADLSQRVI